ncbi:hypothetical protein SLEP1_g41793 [Rubroshorea leprosula]|uniref:Myosin motor domain-containing protein n=1 Tax=Rubroshorea leprosula TaxID=152421 RepID=A0AAV5L7R2_9ROSI|nr:hypothetical protein SLEP1_g41793 [Rubroshorea leprosula]
MLMILLGISSRRNLRVWCRLPNGQWDSGTMKSTSGEESYVSLANGNVIRVSTGDLFPANPEILEGADDLIQISYLNESTVLHNLKYRYTQDMIYRKACPVLIALNPFKHVQLYGNDFVTAYSQKADDSPHVYALADTAYSEMMKDRVNRSIIISGESGAGKTETAKLTMQYLAAVSGGSGGIESEILQTNYILEVFGNAKTSRNDNSSRFVSIYIFSLYFFPCSVLKVVVDVYTYIRTHASLLWKVSQLILICNYPISALFADLDTWFILCILNVGSPLKPLDSPARKVKSGSVVCQ